eukprot:TRINITY_DN56264_c0_g1_i2.p1 TRINITY_DN56264_c0_g1~~TRINITY_DN56264_c0_g1_i2.p1  ORF type:complete len:207 (+),score=28.16 TRINITY_DN56264_c0_g1_i2:139-759(+)
MCIRDRTKGSSKTARPYVPAASGKTTACHETFGGRFMSIHVEDMSPHPGSSAFKQGSFQTGFRGGAVPGANRRPFSATSTSSKAKDRGSGCGRSPTPFLNGPQAPRRPHSAAPPRQTYNGPPIKLGEQAGLVRYHGDEYANQERTLFSGPCPRRSLNYSVPYRLGGKVSQFLSLIHISEPTRLLSISYAVFCLKKKKRTHSQTRYP